MTAKKFGSMSALYATHGTMKKGGPRRQHEDDQTDRKHHVDVVSTLAFTKPTLRISPHRVPKKLG